MIEVKNLTKRFNGNLVWEDVSLTINEGETLAIIGQSGSGKSVLMKHLNALLLPDSGEVLIDGNDIFKMNYVQLRKIRQRFGVLFQGAALFDSINTFENVAFPLRYFTDYDERQIEHEVEEALELVNLQGSGIKETAELSGGMRKRVALARAIILKPEYLLYDEPTSGLDPQTSDEINNLIIDLADNLDITSVVVTHDIHSVLKIAEQVAFLHNQKLCWSGSVEEMRQSDDKNLIDFVTASEFNLKDTGTG